ncbi:hypothetical protein LEMLEM_LOCUS25525 [Lemmus lemmus]
MGFAFLHLKSGQIFIPALNINSEMNVSCWDLDFSWTSLQSLELIHLKSVHLPLRQHREARDAEDPQCIQTLTITKQMEIIPLCSDGGDIYSRTYHMDTLCC